jgi:hypothetical protein
LPSFRAGQVFGRKYIWIAPPSTEGLYAFSSESEEENSTSEDGEEEIETETAAQQYMSNTSRLDVISTSLHPTEADQKRFPDFFNKAVPHAMQAVLEPGDLFLMPVGWWHALKSLDASCSVSMWF